MTTASYVSEELTVVWLLLITAILLAYVNQRKKIVWLPPSSSAMLLGVVVGIFSRLVGLSKPLRFSPAAFFYALLPTIVFDAGFTLKKKQFFKNFGAILMYAVLGTFISALTFGLGTYFLVLIGVVRRSHLGGAPFIECLLYGSAISSIDPVATLAVLSETNVPPLLYNLVFGESVLNDAVSIVLFRSLQQFYDTPMTWATIPAVMLRFCVLALGSLLVGVGVALACAFVLKRFEEVRYGGLGGGGAGGLSPQQQQHGESSSTVYEIAIVVMGSYLAYLVAEVVGMSGIVALFFSGICHAHYSYYNVSPSAQTTLRCFFAFAAFACETFVFAYLGLQVATMQHSFDFGLIFSGVPLAVLSRAANVFPCSSLINLGRTYKLPKNLQSMLWAVGLRGAVAYGLVINLPRADQPGETGIPAIETATLLIVVVTTLGLGSATAPLLRHFGLEGKDDADLYGIALAEDGLGDGLSPGGHNGPARIEVSEHSQLHDRFKELDESVLKPLFGGRHGREGATPSSSRSYLNMQGLDALGPYSPSATADWQRTVGGGGGPGQQQQQQAPGRGDSSAGHELPSHHPSSSADVEIQMQQPLGLRPSVGPSDGADLSSGGGGGRGGGHDLQRRHSGEAGHAVQPAVGPPGSPP